MSTLRRKKVEVIYSGETNTLEDQINKRLSEFSHPSDIIDIKYSKFTAMIIFWED